MTFFDFDDILATQERLPCRVPPEAPEEDLVNLGFLDQSSSERVTKFSFWDLK